MNGFAWQQSANFQDITTADVAEHDAEYAVGDKWQVRLATAEDAALISEFIVPLVRQYIVPSCKADGAVLLLNSLTPAAMAGYLTQDYHYQLAFKNNVLVGVVGLRERRHLFHLFVAANLQRSGLGQKLWFLAWSHAIANGSDGNFTVNAAVHAVEFYKKLGFVATEGPRERSGVIDVPMVGYFPKSS